MGSTAGRELKLGVVRGDWTEPKRRCGFLPAVNLGCWTSAWKAILLTFASKLAISQNRRSEVMFYLDPRYPHAGPHRCCYCERAAQQKTVFHARHLSKPNSPNDSQSLFTRLPSQVFSHMLAPAVKEVQGASIRLAPLPCRHTILCLHDAHSCCRDAIQLSERLESCEHLRLERL